MCDVHSPPGAIALSAVRDKILRLHAPPWLPRQARHGALSGRLARGHDPARADAIVGT
jgi:hypothetical protein